jgi:hypothetical protein
MAELVFPLRQPADCAVHDFVTPEELEPIRFDLCRFVCSSIRRALLRAHAGR